MTQAGRRFMRNPAPKLKGVRDALTVKRGQGETKKEIITQYLKEGDNIF